MSEFDDDFKLAFRNGGKQKDLMYRFLETRMADALKNGQEGLDLFDMLIEMVREEGSEADVKEFQERIGKLLDQDLLGKQVFEAFTDALEKEAEGKTPTEKITLKIMQGGIEGVRVFLRTGKMLKEKGGQEALFGWVDSAYKALPEEDQKMVLVAGIEALIHTEKL